MTSIEMKPKIILAHPGKQHSFRLATALKKEGILFKYITSVYKKQNSIIYKIIESILSVDNKKRAKGRRCDILDDSEVIQFNEILGFILLLIIRLDPSGKLYNKLNHYISNKFQTRVADYAIKNKVDAVILYDTNATICFDILKKRAPHIKRIMDVSAANRIYMKNIYEEDMQRCEKFANKLYEERHELWDNKYLSYFEREIKSTQYFLVPSYFVKKSLQYSKISDDQIFICPYGVDIKQGEIIVGEETPDGYLTIIYIGNVTQMKGIYYLLEAVKRFDSSKVKLKIVGKYDNSEKIFDEYKERYEFVGLVTHDKIEELCKMADFFVFPSLGEGMSLAALEGLSFGLPVVVTDHAGVNDVVIDEYNGFVIPIGNIDAIVEKIKWFLENKHKIAQMRRNAHASAKQYTWERYEMSVVNQIKEILKRNHA